MINATSLFWHDYLITLQVMKTQKMKSFTLLFIFMISALFAGAQDSWRITINKISVIASSKSNESENTKKIKSTEWNNKTGYLEVNYKEATPSAWLHSLQFADSLGNPILVKDSTLTAKIPLAALRKLFKGKKQIKIYMVISPPNPMMMAPSRMVHLGTLRLP
jgi:hypothetical protein